MSGRAWTTSEVKTLRAQNMVKTAHEIGKELRRSDQAVRSMARKLGLRKWDAPPRKRVIDPAEVEHLRGRIEELEHLLGLNIWAPGTLTRVQSKMAGILLTKEIVSQEMFHLALYNDRQDCDVPQPKIVDVQLSKLRKKLKHAAGIEIKNHWGHGWYLDVADKAKLRDMVWA